MQVGDFKELADVIWLEKVRSKFTDIKKQLKKTPSGILSSSLCSQHKSTKVKLFYLSATTNLKPVCMQLYR
jgi:hypothetical protein